MFSLFIIWFLFKLSAEIFLFDKRSLLLFELVAIASLFSLEIFNIFSLLKLFAFCGAVEEIFALFLETSSLFALFKYLLLTILISTSLLFGAVVGGQV